MREAAKDDDRGARATAAAGGGAGAVAASRRRPDKAATTLARAKKAGATTRPAQTTISIALTPAAGASAALKRLQAARPDEWTRIYLDERRANEASVGFFLDAAEFFLAKGDRENRAFGLRALSNLAELDLQNRQVLRLLAYRLQQAGEIDAARADASSASSSWRRTSRSRTATSASRSPTPARRRRRSTASTTVVTGALGRALRRHRPDRPDRAQRASSTRRAATAAPVDVARDRPRLLRNLPLDVRVVLAWDADNTDVDLHVIDAERRGGLLRPQPLVPGRRDHARRDRRLRPRGVRAAASPSRASTASRRTSSAIASRC